MRTQSRALDKSGNSEEERKKRTPTSYHSFLCEAQTKGLMLQAAELRIKLLHCMDVSKLCFPLARLYIAK